MPVISLTMDLGVFTKQWPSRLADALGVRCIDHRKLEMEIADRGWGRDGVVRQYVYDSPMMKRWPMTLRQFSLRLTEETLDAAAGGNVLIVGWAASEILRYRPAVVHLAGVAPLALRAQNVALEMGYRLEATACCEIESRDYSMLRYVQRSFPAFIDDDRFFDAVLDAGEHGEDECIAIARDSVRHASPRRYDFKSKRFERRSSNF